MEVLVTTCSAEKDHRPGVLPAIERYVHPRIRAAERIADSRAVPLYIFSGVYGLIGAHTPLPWYDHALQPDEVHSATMAFSRVLSARRIDRVTALMEPRTASGWAPYHAVLTDGCARAGVVLSMMWWDPIVGAVSLLDDRPPRPAPGKR